MLYYPTTQGNKLIKIKTKVHNINCLLVPFSGLWLLRVAESLKCWGDCWQLLHGDSLLLSHSLKLINRVINNGGQLRLERGNDLGNQSVLVNCLLLEQCCGELLLTLRWCWGGESVGSWSCWWWWWCDSLGWWWWWLRSELQVALLSLPGLSVSHDSSSVAHCDQCSRGVNITVAAGHRGPVTLLLSTTSTWHWPLIMRSHLAM